VIVSPHHRGGKQAHVDHQNNPPRVHIKPVPPDRGPPRGGREAGEAWPGTPASTLEGTLARKPHVLGVGPGLISSSVVHCESDGSAGSSPPWISSVVGRGSPSGPPGGGWNGSRPPGSILRFSPSGNRVPRFTRRALEARRSRLEHPSTAGETGALRRLIAHRRSWMVTGAPARPARRAMNRSALRAPRTGADHTSRHVTVNRVTAIQCSAAATRPGVDRAAVTGESRRAGDPRRATGLATPRALATGSRRRAVLGGPRERWLVVALQIEHDRTTIAGS